MDSKNSLEELMKNMVLSKNDEFVLRCDEPEVEETSFEQILDWKDIEPQLQNEGDNESADVALNLPFDELSSKMVDIGYDEKIKKRYIKEGEGDFVSSTAIVYIHYNMYFEMEPVPFDSTTLRSSFPVKIKLGDNSVIPGLELAILTMKKGEKSQFLIHPDLAYGEIGAPPRIPPDVWILVEIKVEDFVDGLTVEEAKNPEKDEFPVSFSKCEILNKEGNFFFTNSHIKSALERYKSARDLLSTATPETDDEKKNKRQLYIKISQNIMICLNKNLTHRSCCSIAKELFQNYFEEADRNTKLHYNYAKALSSLYEFDLALKHIKRALELEPTNLEVGHLMKKIALNKSQFANKEKSFYKKGLGLQDENSKQDLITEESETEKIIREHLEMFKNIKQSSMALPNGLTQDEIDTYNRICKSMKLEFKIEQVHNQLKCIVRKQSKP